MSVLLLPYPKKLTLTDGVFNTRNCSITLEKGIDRRIIKKAAAFKTELDALDSTEHCFLPESETIGQIHIGIDNSLTHEEYTLKTDNSSLIILGGDAAGCFYGLQTLNQLVSLNGNKIPTLFIEDKPDSSYRGFYHDATRGRIPTVFGLKKIIDRLASLKINSFQLYIEHSFDFKEFESLNRTASDYLTAAELMEIDDYCYENFIDFVPSLSTFGHLYELLSLEKYRHLCELENFKPEKHFWYERMMHHTIDPEDPESFSVVCSLIDQYLPLFRSEYFNICCDETFDLGKGKNAGKDAGVLYCEFVNKLIKYVNKKGKKVMMWGDIALHHRNSLNSIPKDTLFLNWDYCANPLKERVDIVKESGFDQIVCPGTSSWARFIEDPKISVPNITKLFHFGKEAGALGLLNTNWGDYGHPAHFECCLFGLSVGACVCYNNETKIDENFELAVSRLIFKTDENIMPIIYSLSAAQNTALWQNWFNYLNSGSVADFKSNASDIEASVKSCESVINTLNSLKGDNDILDRITNAAKGILLLNKAALKQFGKNSDVSLLKDAETFLENYRSHWLSDCKQSELNEIEKFVLKIAEY